jgi:hypothetical protein
MNLGAAILDLLEDAHGPARAVTLDDMAMHAGTSRRQVEQYLEEHIDSLGFLVVSGTAGYFRPTNAEQVNHYLASLQSRLRKLAIRKRKVIRTALADGMQREGKVFHNQPAPQPVFREFLFPSMGDTHR